MSEDLAGRTATMIKNRFNTKLKSILHEIRREKARQAGKGYQGAEIAKV